MASSIKAIEAKSVHQIQSGQVIVDLCSVVKELVENALDAGSTAIEVRFKNNGLDAIEVQDNGTGIAESNYESLALKHYTSKLSTYEDLLNVQTFGFRGEALSSLCALSDFSVVTAQAHEAPKGKRLEFELSGKLRSTNLTAAQKGTTVTVENLFSRLPVRQKELSKNIKREYGKVVGVLHAYACISTQVKFTVKSAMPKSRSSVVFSTKGNSTTRDNIANVYGAKMLPQLIELDLKLKYRSTAVPASDDNNDSADVFVSGHISKPVFGEGRQTPDRQMFFVNGRPCGLPQIAKAINEVYKSYNVSQSPFIFADFQMDTAAYDVNVSPDKRTILLHDAAILIDHLKDALIERFDQAEQTVPQSQVQSVKLPSFKQLTVSRPGMSITKPLGDLESPGDDTAAEYDATPKGLLKEHFQNFTSTRGSQESDPEPPSPGRLQKALERKADKVKKAMEKRERLQRDNLDGKSSPGSSTHGRNRSISGEPDALKIPVRDFNARMEEQALTKRTGDEVEPVTKSPPEIMGRSVRQEEIGIMPDALDRMRPRRSSPEIATIRIGDKTITRMIGKPRDDRSGCTGDLTTASTHLPTQFSQSLQRFDLRSGDQRPEIDEASSSGEYQNNLAQSPRSANSEDTTPSKELDMVDANNEKSDVNEIEQSHMSDERLAEENRVAELIRLAEETHDAAHKDRNQRAKQVLKGSTSKGYLVNQTMTFSISLKALAEQTTKHQKHERQHHRTMRTRMTREESSNYSDEERLSLTISKSDFARMHVAGQFNLGFIIAVRRHDADDTARSRDELFIIDQHASDEKYNFERLQAETVVGNQRLVHPAILELTAVEEEVIIENESALRQNGFIIEADQSGDVPIGLRCKLLSLPLSKEVTFNVKDLEELIHLLADSHISAGSTYVPRPSKVRKMFAMRACRSSIMIGKTLSTRQMKKVLEHMGRLNKPWNCPHGRPTMRHLTSLDKLDGRLWSEGDGAISADTHGAEADSHADTWRAFIA